MRPSLSRMQRQTQSVKEDEMATAMQEYNGVRFGDEKESRVIQARSIEAAKKEMEKLYGPEKAEDGSTRWVCGLAPKSMTGHDVRV